MNRRMEIEEKGRRIEEREKWKKNTEKVRRIGGENQSEEKKMFCLFNFVCVSLEAFIAAITRKLITLEWLCVEMNARKTRTNKTKEKKRKKRDWPLILFHADTNFLFGISNLIFLLGPSFLFFFITEFSV